MSRGGNGWVMLRSVFTSAGLLVCGSGAYAEINPVGTEFVVSPTDPNNQRFSEVALADDGRFAVVWNSQDPSGQDVLISFFDAAGNVVRANLQVPTVTAGGQVFHSVDVDGSGNYYVHWFDAPTNSNYLRKFDRDGNALTPARVVNVAGVADGGDISVDELGNIVAVYVATDGGGVFQVQRRRFDSNLVPLELGDVLIATPGGVGTNRTFSPKVDRIRTGPLRGDFAVSWQVIRSPLDATDVFVQTFDAAGNAKGVASSVTVAGSTAHQQLFPDVAINDNGTVGVSFTHSPVPFTGEFDIYIQRFDASGAAVGDSSRVNTFTQNRQIEAAIASEPDGDLVVVWQSIFQDGSSFGIFGQAVRANGALLGPEFQVNTKTSGPQFEPTISMNRQGRFVVTWTDELAPIGRIRAQRYDAVSFPMDGDATVAKFSTQARPGFDLTYFITVFNRGGQPIRNLEVTDQLPPNTQVTIQSITPAVAAGNISGVTRDDATNVVTWTIRTLGARSSESFQIRVTVNAINVRVGDVLKDRVTLNDLGMIEDSDPANNETIRCTEVVGSIDPNVKLSDRPRFISAGDMIWFAIHFENVGNADAINIRITDALDTNLDISTLEAISGGGVLDPESRTIDWDLRGINLPPRGEGIVTFRIQPLSTLVVGDTIRDVAAIIFDFNPPLETNTVLHIIGSDAQIELEDLILRLGLIRGDIDRTDLSMRRSLSAKILQAIKHLRSAQTAIGEDRPGLATNQLRAASNILGALLQEISALAGKSIPQQTAEDWTNRAEEVRQQL